MNLRRFILVPLLALSCSSPALAADEALITEDDVWNLFTSVDLKAAELGDDTGYFGGLEVGGILNERLALGLAGYTLIDQAEIRKGFTADVTDLWYAGGLAEYTFSPASIVHPSLQLFAGIGRARNEGSRSQDAQFQILEPAISFMVNLTPSAEIGLSLGYRFTNIRDSDFDIDESDLDGVSGTLFLRLTEF